MNEIKKYGDLLSLLEENGHAPAPEALDRDDCVNEEDGEVLEWASLLSKANAGVMQKARLRICAAGLKAVERHLANVSDASW